MHDQSKRSAAGDGSELERAIVLALLDDEREQAWSRAELAAELDADARFLAHALERLERDGVADLAAGTVSASRAALRLDALGLIAV